MPSHATETLVPIGPDTPIDEVRAATSEWVEQNVPAVWRDAASGGLQALRAVRSRTDYEAWYPTFAASGLVVPFWPREYGGLGLSNATFRVIEEVLAPYNLGRLNVLGINLAGTTLLEWGTEEQKLRYLPPIIRNEELWCQLFSEPGAGSDLPSLATRAVRDGDQWVVNGQKVWSTWAHKSRFGMLLARTDPASAKRDGISYFIIDMEQSGVEVRPLIQITGEHDFNEVFFDDAIVPTENLLGSLGNGWAVARTTLGGERQMISGAGSGGVDNLGGRSVERLIATARETGAWTDPRVRQQLMRLHSQRQTIAWTNLRARAARKAGRTPGAEASIGKLLQAHHNIGLQEAWIDLVGMRAVARHPDDDDAARLRWGFLRSRANTIEGGTSEVQRNTIGERVLGLPREPDPYHGLPWSEIPRS